MDNGVCKMHVKVETSAAQWRGIDNVPNGPGFVLLTRFPDAPPLPVPPNQEVVQQDVITHLRSQAMIDACRTQGKAENLKLVWECSETGRVPTLGPVSSEEKERRAKWGVTERAAFSYPIEVVRTTCRLASTQAFF